MVRDVMMIASRHVGRLAAASLAALSLATLTAACSSATPEDQDQTSNALPIGTGGGGLGGGKVDPPPPPKVVWPPYNPQYCVNVDPYCMITGTFATPPDLVAKGCASTSIVWYPDVPGGPKEYGQKLVLCPSSTAGQRHLGLCDKCAPAAPSNQVYIVIEDGLPPLPGPCQSGCHQPTGSGGVISANGG